MRALLSMACLCLVAAAPTAAGAAPLRLCGDDYWFTVEAPRGWEASDRTDAMGVGLALHPAGSEQPSIGVFLMEGGTPKRPRTVDLDASLHFLIGMISLRVSPDEIRPWKMSHPRLPTRSVVVEGDGGGRIYLSVVDAGSGQGAVFAVLAGQAGPASAEMQRHFQGILASLHFDATRVCGPGPGGEVVEKRVEPAAAPAAPAPVRPDAFPLMDALSGCILLQQLFVDVRCEEATLNGGPVEVVEFRDGQAPARTLLERHRGRVTGPWCLTARSRSDAPRLLLGAHGEDTYREYSCTSRGWVGSVRSDELAW